ncbi:twin-arginine translocase subunit TatC [Desulfitobacterium metallireducens]|uniref:Sec-independent protein translocase protein TatC n=1 Tax=Desulfitobacterium metallireducens DSM 15288 TaxID=871968 RepID=W0EDG0_9FIRM|nr:twin-arginine translocase subunit TatC [Desulfitobacterium metallireducens]AHF07214.1 preprotein translocase subunit TatC [Desulfitobacterium metallireducens DSM 15288]
MRRRKRNDENMPLMEHIRALRKVLVISAYGIALGTVLGWAFSDMIFAYLARPVLELAGVSFITTTPMEPMMVKLKVSIVTGVVVALPILIWQIWSFILPALKQTERKYLYMIVPSSIFLFLLGDAFSFYLVIPLGIKFLLFTGGSIQSTTLVTQSSYLSFLITFILTFGIVFQLPIVLLLLIRIGIVTPQTLAKKRKWAFFGIVALTMLVSPTPDIPTQLLMAGPMYLLYEISIWLGYLVVKKREKALNAS